MEYTRLDELIDAQFTTAQDVEKAIELEPEADENIQPKTETKSVWEFTDSTLSRKSAKKYWMPLEMLMASN